MQTSYVDSQYSHLHHLNVTKMGVLTRLQLLPSVVQLSF